MVKNKKIKKIKNKFVNSGNEKNAFYIFGKNPIFEILKESPDKVKKIFCVESILDKNEKKNILEIAKENKILIENISEKNSAVKVGNVIHQGFLAEISKYKYYDQLTWEIETSKSKEKKLVILLDKVEDVGNFGAIIRSAAAFGVDAIFVCGNNQAPVNGTVFKTSAGNISKIKIIKVSNISQMIEKLKNLNFWTYAIDMPEQNSSKKIWDEKFEKNTAFVLGAEGKGIAEKIKEKCDFILPIAMENDVESLNVSVSAAISMYEWKRQNKK